jgi:hypothetical protein
MTRDDLIIFNHLVPDRGVPVLVLEGGCRFRALDCTEKKKK